MKNFDASQLFPFTANLSLLLQLCTVYPMLLLIVGKPYPGAWSVLGLNVCIMGLTLSFALFYPNVGDVLRYSGAFCGLMLMWLIPVLIHLRATKNVWCSSKFLHWTIVLFGCGVIVLQFIKLQ